MPITTSLASQPCIEAGWQALQAAAYYSQCGGEEGIQHTKTSKRISCALRLGTACCPAAVWGPIGARHVPESSTCQRLHGPKQPHASCCRPWQSLPCVLLLSAFFLPPLPLLVCCHRLCSSSVPAALPLLLAPDAAAASAAPRTLPAAHPTLQAKRPNCSRSMHSREGHFGCMHLSSQSG